MGDLAPKISVGEIPAKVRTIQGVSTSFIATVGVFEKGPIGVPTFIAGADEFARIFGGANAKGISALAFDKYFKNGGRSGFFTRTAHYSDPNDPLSLTALKAKVILDDRRPDAGIKAKGTYKLNANTLVAFVQSSATIEIINNAFDANDEVTINGVSFVEGTEWTAGGDITASALALATAINNSVNVLIDGIITAAIDPGNSARIILTAVAFGTGGDALTLAEIDGATDNFTISGANFSGGIDGDSVTVGALTANAGEDFLLGATIALTITALVAFIDGASAEVTAIVDPSIEDGSQALFTAILVGLAGNSLALTKVDTNSSANVSGATLAGGQETDSEQALEFEADDGEGIHANGRIARIDSPTNGLVDHFNLLIIENALVVDTFTNLNMDLDSDNYVEKRVNGRQLKKS